MSLGVESYKNGPFQGTVGVGRHANVCDGRWRYSGAVLPQEGKTFVAGDRLLPSFFWGMEDQQPTNSRNENLKTFVTINSLDNS